MYLMYIHGTPLGNVIDTTFKLFQNLTTSHQQLCYHPVQVAITSCLHFYNCLLTGFTAAICSQHSSQSDPLFTSSVTQSKAKLKKKRYFVCVYINIHTHVYINLYTYINVYKYIHIYVYVCTYKFIMHIHIYLSISLYIYPQNSAQSGHFPLYFFNFCSLYFL